VLRLRGTEFPRFDIPFFFLPHTPHTTNKSIARALLALRAVKAIPLDIRVSLARCMHCPKLYKVGWTMVVGHLIVVHLFIAAVCFFFLPLLKLRLTFYLSSSYIYCYYPMSSGFGHQRATKDESQSVALLGPTFSSQHNQRVFVTRWLTAPVNFDTTCRR
jgi:hypothetical protein